MKAVARQVGGQATLEARGGTEFRIPFPDWQQGPATCTPKAIEMQVLQALYRQRGREEDVSRLFATAAMRGGDEGFVNGTVSDQVFYHLVTKR